MARKTKPLLRPKILRFIDEVSRSEMEETSQNHITTFGSDVFSSDFHRTKSDENRSNLVKEDIVIEKTIE